VAVRCHQSVTTTTRQIAQFFVHPSSNFADPPCSAASFEVNSEPHTGARPAVRLCVGLIIMNTASKLGPRTQMDRGTCPGVGL
jgi:hypothetical protein